MATSSDSEAFESADEDFMDETKKKSTDLNSTNDNVDKNNEKQNKLEITTKSTIMQTPAEPTVSTIKSQGKAEDVKINKEIENNKKNVKKEESPPIQITKDNNKKSNDFKMDDDKLSVTEKGDTADEKLVQNTTATEIEVRTHEKSDKMKKEKNKEISLSKDEINSSNNVFVEKPIYNENVSTDIEKLKVEPPKINESDDADGWEFDDWDDTPNTKDIKQEALILEKCIDNKETVKETEESAESGWDIDDWDDVDTVEVINNSLKEKKTNSVQHQQKTDFFGNISKLLISSEESPPLFQRERIDEPPTSNISNVDDGNWGWGKSWGGVASLLSTASVGVASITSQVSSAIESSIGVPDPRELARRQQRENQISNSDIMQNDSYQKEVNKDELLHSSANLKSTAEHQQLELSNTVAGKSLGHFVSGFTQIGNRVITGGLDTLEGIGKKTMTILQENDAGLLTKQKELMNRKGPVLSQILREAKEKTEEAENAMKLQQKKYKKQIHFETLFDDYHGLVHLEALEMLSHQSQLKIESLLSAISGRVFNELKETLDEVKELCELPEQEDDSDGNHTVNDLEQKFATAIEDLGVPIDFKDIFYCWKTSVEWLETTEQPEPQDVHDKALRCLAETTALAVLRMHKLAELLLIKERHSTADEADALVQLTLVMCWHLGGIATRFGGTLTKLENVDEANSLITSTFLEGTNSTSYIQNAFQLFIPIIQEGAV